MACSTKTVLLIISILFISVALVSGGLNSSEARIGKILSQPGKKCFVYRWNARNLNQPCVSPVCNITLSFTLFKASGSITSEAKTYLLSKQARQNNGSTTYSECLYDSGESASCCGNINPEAVKNITSAHQVHFSDYEKIVVAVNICVRGGSCYGDTTGPHMNILPWRDPCFTNKPCQQRGFAACHSVVDDYRCSCQYRWTGKNCDVRRNMTALTYKVGKCLNTSSETSVQFLQGWRVEECNARCLKIKCKSFEFRIMPSSLIGNCTLYDVNSLDHKMVSCDADLYELKSFLTSTNTNSTAVTPTNHPGVSTVVIVIVVIIALMILISLIVVLIAKPSNRTPTPTRSQSNLGALPRGTRPRDQELAPLAAPEEAV